MYLGFADKYKSYANWMSLTRDSKSSTIRNHVDALRTLEKNKVVITDYESVQSFVVKGKDTYSSSHINNCINVAKVYNQFLKSNNSNYSEELIKFKYIKEKYKPKATMSDEEIEAFLNIPCKTQTLTNWQSGSVVVRRSNPKAHEKWTTFFYICAMTGARMGEVASLKVEDIDFGRNIILVNDTKTNEPRNLPIATALEPIIKSWIDKVEKGYLFSSKRPEGHVSSVEWGYEFHDRIKRLGIKRPNLTPYSLRHSLITRLLEEDINIFKVQKIVGHKDIKTTLHYTHLTTKDIVMAINKHPLVRKHANPQNILKMVQSFLEGLDFNGDRRFKVNLTRKNESLNFSIEIVDSD